MSIAVAVYDPTNTGLLAALPIRWGVRWREAHNSPGMGEVTVLAGSAGASQLAFMRVIRITPSWGRPFAFMIEEIDEQTRVEGTQQAITVRGRDLMTAWLAQAPMLPDYGLRVDSGPRRYFGYMSSQSAWYVPSEWNPAVQYPINAPSIKRTSGAPEAWPIDYEWVPWIWHTTPVPAMLNEYGWQRYTFNSGDVGGRVVVLASGDDSFELWLDGEWILRSDPVQTWRRTYETRLALGAGVHTLAAETINGASYEAGIVVMIATVDPYDEITGAVVTTADGWLARAGGGPTTAYGRPGWFGAQIIKKLVEEAQALAIPGPSSLSIGWTDSTDSDSAALVGRREVSFAVLQKVSEVTYSVAEDFEVDIWVDYATNTIKYSQAGRGSDVSGSVSVAVGTQVMSLRVDRKAPRATVVLGLSERGWVTAEDAVGIASVGRIFGGVELGGAAQYGSAVQSAQSLLAQQSTPATDVSLEYIGAPYFGGSYDLGDTITAPIAADGTPGGCKVIACTVTENDDGVPVFRPELSVVGAREIWVQASVGTPGA